MGAQYRYRQAWREASAWFQDAHALRRRGLEQAALLAAQRGSEQLAIAAKHKRVNA